MKMVSLDRKRNNRVMGCMHKASSKVVEIALERNIDTIIIGKNTGWKMNVEMRKSDKQNFIQIPYTTFIDMIRYKAERRRVQVIVRKKVRDLNPTFSIKTLFLCMQNMKNATLVDTKKQKRCTK